MAADCTNVQIAYLLHKMGFFFFFNGVEPHQGKYNACIQRMFWQLKDWSLCKKDKMRFLNL